MERFGERGGVVLVAAAERGVVPERWGLGVALAVTGSTVNGAALVVDDGLADRDPLALASIEAWAAATTMPSPAGPVPISVVTRRGFCDPDRGLLLTTYTGGRWLVTADEGRSLGLLGCEPPPGRSWPAARGRFRGGFSIGLPGWGEYDWRIAASGRKWFGWQPRLHRPPLRVKALGAHGLSVEWARAGIGGWTKRPGVAGREQAGHWEKGLPFRGRLVDLLGPAHAFDGIDTSDLSEHAAAFGIPGSDVPAAVSVSAHAAAHLLDVTRSVHALALALDEEAGTWLIGPGGTRTLDLRSIYSPGAPAKAIFARTGVTPPLRRFEMPDEALDRWMQAAHGGWCTSTVRAQVVPVVDVDVRQAYPSAWSLLGCWDALSAERIEHRDVSHELRALCEEVAAGNFAPIFDPATYRNLGLVLARVVPDGEPWPVERPGTRGPRFDVVAVRSAAPLSTSGWDVLNAAALSGRVPRIVDATRLVPVGRQEGLRPVRLREGVTVPAGHDPIPALVRLRPPKGGDERLRSFIRGIANPAAWGIFAQIDQDRVGGALRERPASWSWPPIAASVPAVARLWLGLVERRVRDLGGAVVSRDTDGIAIVASPQGARVELADGRVTHALSWEQVDGILAPFDALDPFGDGGAFWSVDREHAGRPLHMLSLGPKRYVLAVRDDDGYRAVGGTEHSLGGGVADPPPMAGRDADRRHVWTLPVAQHALHIAAIAAAGVAAGWRAPWDDDGADPWPVLRKFSAGSPGVLVDVPDALGAHPFAAIVEGQVDRLYGDACTPIALDPGDLCDWRDLDWRDPAGSPVHVATVAGGALRLRDLDGWALSWCRGTPVDPPDVVEVDPRLIRRVGRGGALVDALLADPNARAEDHQVLYDGGDPGAFVAGLVERLGQRPFAAAFEIPLSTVHDIAHGARADAATVGVVLDALASDKVPFRSCAVCGALVLRGSSLYCSTRCRETAKARRRRARSSRAPWRPCALGGCVFPRRPRSETCTEAHRKALARARARGEASWSSRALARRLRSLGGARCPACRAVYFGNLDAGCPACDGRGVEVVAVTCPGCGIGRVGDLGRPCPFCDKECAP